MFYELNERSKIESFRIRDIVIPLIFISSYYIIGGEVNGARNKNVFLSNVTEVVRSKNELENILDEEKEKINLENVDIKLNITDKYIAGHSIRIGENAFRIDINPERMNRLVVRHELYHVYCWEKLGWPCFPGGPIEEWKATSYAIKETN